jgi:hypothetical protein
VKADPNRKTRLRGPEKAFPTRYWFPGFNSIETYMVRGLKAMQKSGYFAGPKKTGDPFPGRPPIEFEDVLYHFQHETALLAFKRKRSDFARDGRRFPLSWGRGRALN